MTGRTGASESAAKVADSKKPVGKKSAVKKLAGSKVAAKKPAGKKPAERKPARRYPSPKKGDEKKSRFLSRWFLLVPAVLILFTIVLSAWYYEPAKIWYREVRQERVLREQLASIQAYNDRLAEEVASLETTPGIQAFAQQQLGFIMEGDNVIIVTRDGVPITEPMTTREMAITSIPDTAQPFGAWTDFLDTFFGIE